MRKQTYFWLYDALQYTMQAMDHLFGISAIATKISEYDLTIWNLRPKFKESTITVNFDRLNNFMYIYLFINRVEDVKNNVFTHRVMYKFNHNGKGENE